MLSEVKDTMAHDISSPGAFTAVTQLSRQVGYA